MRGHHVGVLHGLNNTSVCWVVMVRDYQQPNMCGLGNVSEVWHIVMYVWLQKIVQPNLILRLSSVYGVGHHGGSFRQGMISSRGGCGDGVC